MSKTMFFTVLGQGYFRQVFKRDVIPAGQGMLIEFTADGEIFGAGLIDTDVERKFVLPMAQEMARNLPAYHIASWVGEVPAFVHDYAAREA